MKVSILCSDSGHPVFTWLHDWASKSHNEHDVDLVQSKNELTGGDILFLVSCSEIVGSDIRARYQATLVIHASDLPCGRGWSPHVWQVLEGKNRITVSLLEAEDSVDSGKIWAQKDFHLAGDELFDEINEKLFQAELELMDIAVAEFHRIQPKAQVSERATYYPKRTPGDSRLLPEHSIADQFDLLRVADPSRFPGYFDYRGYRYEIVLKKIGPADEDQ